MIIQNSALTQETETSAQDSQIQNILAQTQPVKETVIAITEVAKAEVKVPKIILSNLVMPKDVIMDVKKSCTKFSKAGLTKKAYLKGTQFEITDLVQSLDSRTTKFDPKLIRKNHLGNSKGTIKNVKDTSDLQDIINQYWA